VLELPIGVAYVRAAMLAADAKRREKREARAREKARKV
jgi:hypothetical protein